VEAEPPDRRVLLCVCRLPAAGLSGPPVSTTRPARMSGSSIQSPAIATGLAYVALGGWTSPKFSSPQSRWSTPVVLHLRMSGSSIQSPAIATGLAYVALGGWTSPKFSSPQSRWSTPVDLHLLACVPTHPPHTPGPLPPAVTRVDAQ
ncbi:hypothetical protein NHX12_000934, partial [Muraenolepis orangiensis]